MDSGQDLKPKMKIIFKIKKSFFEPMAVYLFIKFLKNDLKIKKIFFKMQFISYITK